MSSGHERDSDVVKHENMTIAGERGAFEGDCVAPDQRALPGVLLVQEIVGVDAFATHLASDMECGCVLSR